MLRSTYQSPGRVDLKSTQLSLAVIILALYVGASAPACAFDFFGLFGGDVKPKPSREAVAYDVSFSGLDDDSKVEQTLKDASNSWRLRLESPSAGIGLTHRVVADYAKLKDALWASGYYNASIRASVAGVAVQPDGRGADAAASAAERFRDKSLVPVKFEVALGPAFHLRKLVVLDARTRAPIDAALFPRRAFDVDADEPIRAGGLIARQAEWIDDLRAKSYPLAKIVDMRPVVRHDDHVVDVTVSIDPGPRGGIGDIHYSGSSSIDPAVIRSFVYLEEGEDYSPKKLADTRKSIARIEAVGGAKVEDAADHLDKNGNMPLLVETSERKRHAIGASAQYDSLYGPQLRTYWVDRNLFGGAERLRLDIEGGLATLGGSKSFSSFSNIRLSDAIGRIGASFIKPALWGTRNDLLVDVYGAREVTNFYKATYGNGTIGIRHRFSDYASIQSGVEVEIGRTFDVFGNHTYSLLGFPIAATYDSTDNALAPTRGIRAFAKVTPYVKALPHGVGMVQSKGQISGYYAIEEDAWYILAARLAAGSIVGANIQDVPANRRFFAGGGGSVRGYRFRSLAPDNGFGFATGGRSLLEGSLEARVKVTPNIGVVPFVDAGAAFSAPYPDFRTTMRAAAGVGLRYYTGIGPIRFDVATPINPRRGDGRLAVFIGIGESF